MLVPEFLQELCRESIDKRTILEGVAARQQGLVLASNVTLNDGDSFTINARVGGMRGQRFTVTVDIYLCDSCVDWHIDSRCSCPLTGDCQHVVAAIAAAQRELPIVDHQGSLIPQASSVGYALPKTREALLAAEFQHWISDMSGREKEGDKKGKAATPKVILFILRHDPENHAEVKVHLMRASRLKSGALGKKTAYAPSSPPTTLPAQLLPEDLHLIRLLIGETGSLSRDGFTLRDAFGAELLRQILATGRCYWQREGGTPLTLGEERSGALEWRRNATGEQAAAMTVTPAAPFLLPLEPPFYVEPEKALCGPVKIAIAARLRRRWLEAPAVSPEMSAAAAKALAAAGLPSPVPLRVVSVGSVAPKPVLKLSCRPSAQRVYNPETGYYDIYETDVAQLFFDYAGTVVPCEPWAGSLRRVVEDRVETISRDGDFERRTADRLTGGGFRHASYAMQDGNHGFSKFSLATPAAWEQFVSEGAPKLVAAGWRVEYDESFRYRRVEVDDWYSETSKKDQVNDWFAVELGIIVEGQRVNLLPLLREILALVEKDKVAGKKGEFVDVRLPDGRTVKLPNARLLAIGQTLAELHDPASLVNDRLEVGKLRAAELVDICGAGQWKGDEELRELAQRIRSYEGIATVAAPAGLQAQLRTYQVEGLAWLQFLREYGLAGVLADDMGLGKTVQALAHILMEKQSGRATLPSLVIAPTSLMANWKAEAARFTPDLRVLVSHGWERKEHHDKLADYDLIVTSYSLLPRDEETLKKQPFHLVILDEAQYVKNPNTKWSDVARGLSARHRLCMTGTPMENHLGELWSLMTFLSPGYLGTAQQFSRMYRTPIEKHGDVARKQALAKRLRPFIMRRKKEEVAKELPPKTEITRAIELDGAQRDLYETIRLAMHEKVQAEIAKRGIAKSHIIILDALLKLRQVCCDPRLVKLERARKVGESAKLEFLMEMVPELLAEGRRILLFSQFTSMLDLIEPELKKRKIDFVRLSGDTQDRATPVAEFQAGKVPLFLISLKAGGTGLNLTAADTVIHYDPWWNPAVEQQATDRAHRIGQDKPVFVYKLVTQGTVEEKIIAMQNRKRELVSGLLNDGAAASLALTKDDLERLFDPL